MSHQTILVPGLGRVPVYGSVVPIATRDPHPPDDFDYRVALEVAVPYVRIEGRDEVDSQNIAFNCYAVELERDCPGPPWRIEETEVRDDLEMARWYARLVAVTWKPHELPSIAYQIPYAVYYVGGVDATEGVIDPDA